MIVKKQNKNKSKHFESVHEEKKLQKCSICHYSCSEISKLKIHVKSVYETRSHIRVLFVIKVVLKKVHIDSVHEKEKPYFSLWDSNFSEKGRLKQHIESVYEEKKKKIILTALSMPNIIIVTKNKQDQTCEPGSVAMASG